MQGKDEVLKFRFAMMGSVGRGGDLEWNSTPTLDSSKAEKDGGRDHTVQKPDQEKHAVKRNT